MAKPGGLTHMFVELSLLDELGVLLGRSTRLKYTCLSVSRKFLVLGSNTGGVYIFSRDTLKYLQVVFGDTEACPVVRVSVSPSDQHVALALSSGNVAVIELNIDKRAKPDKIRYIQEHTGHTVTALTWDGSSSKVFVGDNSGKISIIFVPTSKSKTLFTAPFEVIAYLDVSVYQMEWWKDKLLVSTITHTHLFDTTKHNYTSIGTKSRDGEFGASFFMEPSCQATVIYCARPGSRMWEVDFEGKVLNTHQFKQLLAVPPIPVIKLVDDSFHCASEGTHPTQSVNFFKMMRIGQFIITWSTKGLYLFDPINVKVVLWTQSFKGIKDMVVYNSDVYLFLDDTSVHKLTLLPIYQIFTLLSSRERWSLMSSLLLAADQVNTRPAIVKRVKQDLLQTLLAGLRENGKMKEVERVRAAMEDISEGSIESLSACEDFMESAEVMGHTYLPSGMVIVSEGVQLKRGTQDTGSKVVDKQEVVGVENVYTRKVSNAGNSETHEKVERSESFKDSQLLQEGLSQQIKDEDQPSVIIDENHHEHVVDEAKGRTNADHEGSEQNSSADQPMVDTVVNDEKNNNNLSEQVIETKQDINSDIGFSQNDSDVCNETHSGISEKDVSDAQSNSVHSAQEVSGKMTPKQNEAKINDADTASINGSDLEGKVHELARDDNVGSASTSDEKSVVENDGLPLSNGGIEASSEGGEDSRNALKEQSLRRDEELVKEIASEAVPISTSDSTENESKAEKELEQLEADSSIPQGNDTSEVVKSTGNNIQNIPAGEGSTFAVEMQQDSPLFKENNNTLPLSSHQTENAVENEHISSETSHLIPPDTSSISASMEAKYVDSSNIIHSSITTANSSANTSSDHISNGIPSAKEPSPSLPRAPSTATAVNAVSLDKTAKSSAQSDEVPSATPLQDVTIDALAAIGKGDTHHPLPFSSVQVSSTKDADIAKPQKVSKKKKKKKLDTVTRSVSMDTKPTKTKKGTLKSSVSLGDYPDDIFSESLELEMDIVCIGTISNIEEEEAPFDSNTVRSDVSPGIEFKKPQQQRTMSPELSVSPPVSGGKSILRKSSSPTPSYDGEVIPPLIDRLAAARGSASSDDFLVGLRTHSSSHSSLTASGEHAHSGGSGGSPKASLSAFKDGLSMKLKSQTKSLIKSFKEMNALVTKSSSTPTLAALSPQQLEKSLKDVGSQQQPPAEQQNEASTLKDSMSRIKEKPAVVIDTSPLYITALDIKKRLSDSTSMVKPGALRDALNEWAKELLAVLCHYHEEVQKRSHELDRAMEQEGSCKKEETDVRDSGIENLTTTSVGPSVVEALGEDNSDVRVDHGNNDTSQSEHVHSQNGQTSLASPSVSPEDNKCLTPMYWTKVLHCHDEFHLPAKHEELFKSLTTMCFLSGVTGNILQYLHFIEEAHYKLLLEAVVPQSSLLSLNLHYDHLVPSCCGAENSLSTKTHGISNKTAKVDGEVQLSNTSYGLTDITHPTSSQIKSQSLKSGTSDGNSPAASPALSDSIKESGDSTTVTSESDLQRISMGHGSDIFNLYKSERFLHDLSLSLFTRLFFFILNYDRVKQSLDNGDNKMFLTWISLIMCSKEKGRGDIVSSILADKQVKSAMDYLRSGILPHHSALLGHVYELFEQAPSKTSEFCGEIKKAVTPADLVQLCSLCSKPVSAYLLRYFKQAMVDLATVRRPAAFQQLCRQRVVRYHLLEALLPTQLSDAVGDSSKSLVDQVITVLPHDWLKILLSMVKSEEEREELVKLCIKAGHWISCVQLLTQVDQWKRLLQLIVDVNDITLLKGKQGEEGFLPRNVHEWRYLLKYFQAKQAAGVASDGSNNKDSSGNKLDEGGSSHCALQKEFTSFNNSVAANPAAESDEVTAQRADSKIASSLGAQISGEENSASYSELSFKGYFEETTISWSSLGYLLLQEVGGATAIDLLIEHLEDPVAASSCLSAEFLNACYMDFRIKFEQSYVTHEMLEKMSVYMWAKKPGYVPPSIHHAVVTEKKVKDKGEGEDVISQGMFGQIMTLDSKNLMCEYLGSHWGQEVNISDCCLGCHLPLKSVVSLSAQGVIVFPCGHAFHKCCVVASVCPILHG